MKLARNQLKVWNATWDELRTIDIGSGMDLKFAGERVPKLAEVLELSRGKIGVLIELKYYGHDQQLEQRVVDIVEQYEMSEHIMVMSLKPEGVKKLKAIRPQWQCGVLMSVAMGNVKKIDADFLAVNAKFATRGFVNRSHKIGREVFVWTVDDPASMSMLMNRGVDGIITNRPELTREVLRHRTEMNSSERLLTEIAAILGAEQPPGDI
jgi:glycerophosphoryl diester phosphodiesterase